MDKPETSPSRTRPKPAPAGTGRLIVQGLSRLVPWLILGAIVVGIPTLAILVNDEEALSLKVAAVAVLSFIPGWIYLQFIKNRGKSLYDEYVLNLFRLKIDKYSNLPMPPQHTNYYKLWDREHGKLGTKSKDNLYRKKFESVYGKSAVSTLEAIYDGHPVRERTEAFFPVLMATVLLGIGWMLVLEVPGEGSFSPPNVPKDALRFGFLGAYAFILQDLTRRYFRDDLKTGAYIASTVRIVFVVLIIVAIDRLPWWDEGGPGVVSGAMDDAKNVTAFLIGLFPQAGLQALQAAAAKPLRRLLPSITTDYPLSSIEGLNIWQEARFAEEGIEEMQHLVSADLVDLLLRSRTTVSKLMDWIDQATLALRLPGAKEGKAVRDKLRRLGVRTATDLERLWASPLKGDPTLCARLGDALGVGADEAPAVVGSLLESFKGEVNMLHVRAFRNHEWLAAGPHELEPEIVLDGDVAPAPTPEPAS
ncbi:MAG TPA: hypothetical protein VHG90_11405 [Acidimicrobiales bacterium]|nr:hypothetical protein [Acidimicrobiales bacterium]